MKKLWKGSWGRRIAGRKKSLMDRKMEKKLNKKNNVKKLKQKVDRSAKFLIDDDHLWKYGIIFCEQISWITRSTKWVRLAKCTWSCFEVTYWRLPSTIINCCILTKSWLQIAHRSSWCFERELHSVYGILIIGRADRRSFGFIYKKLLFRYMYIFDVHLVSLCSGQVVTWAIGNSCSWDPSNQHETPKEWVRSSYMLDYWLATLADQFILQAQLE